VAFSLLSSSYIINSRGTIQNPGGLLKLHVNGTYIQDSAGNEVRLVGFNGHPKHPIEGDSLWNLYMDPSHLDWFQSRGFNLLRAVIYPMQYHLAEGVFDESFFIDYIDPVINMCEERGIYVIFSIHQWDISPYFGGQGIPEWVVEGYLNRAGLTSVTETTFSIDMFAGKAYNQDPPRSDAGGAYAQTQFLEAMKYVVDRYKGRGVIVGVQINEPHNMIEDWPSKQSELVPYWLPFQDQIWATTMRSIDPDIILVYSPLLDYSQDGGVHWNTKQTQTNVIWGRNFYDYESYYQRVGRDVVALSNRVNVTFDKFVTEFNAPMIFTEIGTDILDDDNLIWVEDVFNAVNQNTPSKGEWGMAWWRYSFWEIWSPRNPDGTDRNVVPLIQAML